jgi:3-dehydroquinate synthase
VSISPEPMARVDVDLGARSYPIYIGEGLLGREELLRPYVAGAQVCVVTNETVAPLYVETLLGGLGGEYQIDVHRLPDGEQYKTLESYAAIIDFLLARRHARSTTLIALGGGVVGDITGFAAATYQRGVGFLQVPTTLLAQVDSSVGGKTGVNHARGKNMIGAFYQPRCVIADTGVLATLPEREFRAGLAEVVKYGAICDPELFAWLERHAAECGDQAPAALQHAIRRCCEIKASVVRADETESGVRAILNFGHTFGHALETLTGYRRMLHGEAVAVGMVMAADLSARQGRMDWQDARRIRALLEHMALPVEPPAVAADAMLGAMAADKKAVSGRLRLVLLHGIGEATVTEDVDPRSLAETLRAGPRLCRG